MSASNINPKKFSSASFGSDGNRIDWMRQITTVRQKHVALTLSNRDERIRPLSSPTRCLI